MNTGSYCPTTVNDLLSNREQQHEYLFWWDRVVGNSSQWIQCWREFISVGQIFRCYTKAGFRNDGVIFVLKSVVSHTSNTHTCKNVQWYIYGFLLATVLCTGFH